MRGRRESRQPSPRCTVSGSSNARAAMATNTASSSQNTRPDRVRAAVGQHPAKIAPAARPLSGATTPVRAPCQSRSGGCRSSSAALIQPMATPVARPWRMRAANSHTTLGATANTSIATISTDQRGQEHRPPAQVIG